jgi:hypothetical protein
VESLEEDFYLSDLGSFGCVFTLKVVCGRLSLKLLQNGMMKGVIDLKLKILFICFMDEMSLSNIEFFCHLLFFII